MFPLPRAQRMAVAVGLIALLIRGIADAQGPDDAWEYLRYAQETMTAREPLLLGGRVHGEAWGAGIHLGDRLSIQAEFQCLLTDELRAARIRRCGILFNDDQEVTRDKVLICWRTVGERLLEWSHREGHPPTFASVSELAFSRWNAQLGNPLLGGPLWGRISVEHGESVSSLLERSHDLSVAQESVMFEGRDCVELFGHGLFGELRVWLSREDRFALVGFELIKGPDHSCRGIPLAQLRDWGELRPVRIVESLSRVSLKTLDGRVLPTEGRSIVQAEFEGGERSESTIQITYDHHDPTPDATVIAAWLDFGPPNGTHILEWGGPSSGLVHEWRGGRITPIVPLMLIERIEQGARNHSKPSSGDASTSSSSSTTMSLSSLWTMTAGACVLAPIAVFGASRLWRRRHPGVHQR
jgi:hypothetical protein